MHCPLHDRLILIIAASEELDDRCRASSDGGFWRTRRSAAIAGIIFGVLLLAAMIMLRIALSEGSLQTLQADTQRRTLIRISLSLVPFAGIAFLWFIGVVREQLGAVEDRLFSTVFMGSGLLFLAMLFTGQRSRPAG
jgi:hypothetical protein